MCGVCGGKEEEGMYVCEGGGVCVYVFISFHKMYSENLFCVCVFLWLFFNIDNMG